MIKELEDIKKLMLAHTEKQLQFLTDRFNRDSSFLQLELQIKKDLNEYGKILLEKLFPVIYGNGYFGSKVKEINEETKEEETYSCVMREHTRNLKTIFGTVRITRAYYQHDQTGSSLSLLDRKLKLNNSRVSPGVRYYANLVGITTSFSEGKETFEKFMGIHISEKDIDLFTQDKSSEIAGHFAERVQDITLGSNKEISPAIIDADDKNEHIIYLETDGCYVPIRKRKSKEEDWTECKTLLLFEVEKKNPKDEDYEIINKRHFSTVNGIRYFKKQVKCELEEYCKGKATKIVCIGDGAGWIWKMVKELIPNARLEILDWYHVKERITLLARELFPDDKQATDKEFFVDTMKGHFYDGRFDEGIALFKEKYEKTRSRKLQAHISETIDYFENNRDRMNYQEYKKQDFCIGSGAVESANKNVIQRRLKIPGCRWLEEQADNMAHMRAEYANDNFDQWFGIKDNPMLAMVT